MRLTFLEAAGGTRLGKSISVNDHGEIIKTPYPHVKNLTTLEEHVETLEEFHQQLVQHANLGHCLLKGHTTRPLVAESRRSLGDRTSPTLWLIIDLDALQAASYEEALAQLPPVFAQTAHIYQASSSAKLENHTFSGHLFYLLDQPIPPRQLKDYLLHLNLTQPALAQQVSLHPAGRTLRYPLDASVADNTKLIFIAPPIFETPERLADPYPNPADRFRLVTHTGVSRETERAANSAERDANGVEAPTPLAPTLHIDTRTNYAATNKGAVDNLLRTKRQEAGLEFQYNRWRPKIKRMGDQDVIINPDRCAITDVRVQGDYVRMNLQGDNPSWGYWHPIDNPEILYSFKGDGPYLTEQLDQDYHANAVRVLRQQRQEDKTGVEKLVFRDWDTDKYYAGTLDYSTGQLSVAKLSRQAIPDFCASYLNIPEPDPIPTFTYQFAYDDERLFDPEAQPNGFLNQYHPPQVLHEARTRFLSDQIGNNTSATDATRALAAPGIPPTVSKLLHHMCNYHEETIEHFLNWLAVIVQLKKKPRTAWVFHGTQGTGKSKFFELCMRPVIGRDYFRSMQMNDFTSQFAQFRGNSILAIIEEADADSTENRQHASKITQKMKALIDSDVWDEEPKGVDRVARTNYCSYAVLSNERMPVVIPYNDRRWNVAPRQEKRLERIDPTTDLSELVKGELVEWAGYLLTRPANQYLADTALENEFKADLKAQKFTASEEIVHAIRVGDLEFFLNDLPEPGAVNFDEDRVVSATQFETTLRRIFIEHEQLDPEDPYIYLNTSEVEHLVCWCEPKAPKKSKLSVLLRNQGIQRRQRRRDGRKDRYWQTQWIITDDAREAWNDYLTRKQQVDKTKAARKLSTV